MGQRLCCCRTDAHHNHYEVAPTEDTETKCIQIRLEYLGEGNEAQQAQEEIVNIRFNQSDDESRSDSVDDDEYYVSYTTQVEEATKRPAGKTANLILCVMLRQARQAANSAIDTGALTEENMINIACMYDSVLSVVTDARNKRRIIREYEQIRSKFPVIRMYTEKIREELAVARSTEVGMERRRLAYRRAIRLSAERKKRDALAHEYNEFILLSRARMSSDTSSEQQ